MTKSSASNDTDYDVIVVGGGPGGSTTATLIAQEGHRVLLLEKEQFPRYQIGESLLPSTIQGICPLLGVSEELAEAGFPVKRGGTFRWGANPEPWTFAFSENPGVVTAAYQVERAKFDDIMVRNAQKHGVTVKFQHQADGVLREGDRITGVRYRDAENNRLEATSRFVIDASGEGSRLRGEVGGEREMSPDFRSIALFGYWAGGKRLPEPNSGNILTEAFDYGWIWYIPLADDLTSVGIVLRREHADMLQGDSSQMETYRTLLSKAPIVSEYLDGVEMSTRAPYDKLRVRKDYSYHQTKMWAPGMALVGDAGLFVDPVFSTGVHLATYGGLMAARSVNTVLAGELDETTCFDEFQLRMWREYSVLYNFLVVFYQTHHEQDYFKAAQQITQQGGSVRSVFAGLVAGVTSGDFDLSDSLEQVDSVLSSTDGGDIEGLRDVPLMAETLKGFVNTVRMQTGEEEGPMFTNGLAPTADFRHWRVMSG